MACICKANTLRSFIRSISQVDLPSPTLRSPPKQLQRTVIRNFTTIRAIRQQHSEPSKNDPTSSNDDISFSNLSLSTEESPIGSRKWPKEGGNGHAKAGLAGEENAFAEISLDSIDAIVAESRSSTSYESPGRQSNPKAPLRKYVSGPEPGSRTTFRRTKVQNTSFTLHYDNPRVPVKAAVTPSPEHRAEPRLNARSSESAKDEWVPPKSEQWQIDKAALKEKFPEGWAPRKRLSPDALAGIRALHAQMPQHYTTEALAESFEVSPEAIRRILKSKWQPDADEEMDRQRRWFNRGKSIYTRHAEMGLKPPKRWREIGIGNGKPEWKKKKAALPALVTTSRRHDPKFGFEDDSDSLGDRIL